MRAAKQYAVAVALLMGGVDVEARVRLPQFFEENRGQARDAARFVSRIGGASISVDHQGFRLRGQKSEVRVLFDGSKGSGLEGERPLGSRVNYLIGNSPDAWIRGVPAYERVRCRRIYPGIDALYHLREGRLEYDFIVAPGADPGRIRLKVSGSGARATLDEGGNLVLTAGKERYIQRAPVALQDGRRVEARFVAKGDQIEIALGEYDRGKELIIDPVVDVSTYLGGSQLDVVRAVATDPQGNIYIAGTTESRDFPTTRGAYRQQAITTGLPGHVFVAKLSANAYSLEWATYLGGSIAEDAHAIAVGPGGDVYVAGWTVSSNFPTTPGAVQRFYNSGFNTMEGDGFITRLDASGQNLVYSTLLGGDSPDRVLALAVDSSGAAYAAGDTVSENFPVTSGAFKRRACSPSLSRDAFVTKLNPTGTAMVYSTYVCGDRSDTAHAIAIDGSGAAYIAGVTRSTDFPVTFGALQVTTNSEYADAFVAKLSPDGRRLIFASYFGGSAEDVATAMALDQQGNIYLAGYTNSVDFPVRSGSYRTTHSDGGLAYDAFVAKLNPSATALLYSTYLGASRSDRAHALAVDRSGSAYVGGVTESPDFPNTLGPCGTRFGGGEDGFVVRLDANGASLVYAATLGGRGSDEVTAMALDQFQQAMVVGRTDSPDFPTAPYALNSVYQYGYHGSGEVFLSRVSHVPAPPLPCIAVAGIANGADRMPGVVAPGELIHIRGAGFGAAARGTYTGPGGGLPLTLSGTRVLVDGVAVPLLETAPNQIQAFLPFDIAGKSEVAIEVERDGVKTQRLVVGVDAAAPGLFEAPDRPGQALAVNQDGSVNTRNNPAVRGQVLVLYATGLGELEGPMGAGLPAPSAVRTQLAIQAFLGNVAGTVEYAGAAPGLPAGIYQINVRIPEMAPAGMAVPVRIRAGSITAQVSPTVAIR